MSIQPVWGMPGLRADRTAGHRHLFKGGFWESYLPGGRIIAGASARDPDNTGDVDVLRAGLLMGKITSGGKYAPSVVATLGAAAAATATELTLASAAQGAEIVRRFGASGTFILRGPPTANGTIDSEQVTYSAVSGDTVTVSAITNAYVAGSLIQPEDGSEIPITLLPDGYGYKVTDEDGIDIDVPFERVPTMGTVETGQIINYSTDTSIQQWIKDQLLNQTQFVFDDDF